VITARLRPGKKGFLVTTLDPANQESVAAIVRMLDRAQLRKIAVDEVFQHDLGCTCDFCNLMHTRYAAAPIDNPEDFARAGGEHQDYPFQAEQTQHFASISNSLKIVAGAVVGLQNIFRGRDADNTVVQSPYRVLVDFIVGKPQAATGPSTQRAPSTAQQPMTTSHPAQQAQAQAAPTPAQSPVQAPLFGTATNTKAIATDAQMQQMIPNWPARSNTHERDAGLAAVWGSLVVAAPA